MQYRLLAWTANTSSCNRASLYDGILNIVHGSVCHCRFNVYCWIAWKLSAFKNAVGLAKKKD
ncbi:PHD finger and BAH domain protein [Aspergillus luchuensis]|uniref:PHD finger and BAH domain protein n=1 Tax=Aspergillus kawachii TaxID=1069201 RepID=A0A146FG24_ASPKA|nr:PHD finger and BAH domain protein [Aspergillus luchuensis]